MIKKANFTKRNVKGFKRSNNTDHSTPYGVDLWKKKIGKIQKSDHQEPPNFKQFLKISALFFQILTIFLTTHHYN